MKSTFAVGVVEFLGYTGANETGDLSPLFTPEETGLFRISPYVELTIAGQITDGVGQINYGYTDAGGAESINVLPMSELGNSSSRTYSPVLLHLIGGSPVTFFLFDANSNTYNLYFVIEKLG